VIVTDTILVERKKKRREKFTYYPHSFELIREKRGRKNLLSCRGGGKKKDTRSKSPIRKKKGKGSRAFTLSPVGEM